MRIVLQCKHLKTFQNVCCAQTAINRVNAAMHGVPEIIAELPVTAAAINFVIAIPISAAGQHK